MQTKRRRLDHVWHGVYDDRVVSGMEGSEDAVRTDRVTANGERVYDLAPLASDLWAIAGPDGLDPTTVDSDHLPAGYRWVEDEEWSDLEYAHVADNA